MVIGRQRTHAHELLDADCNAPVSGIIVKVRGRAGGHSEAPFAIVEMILRFRASAETGSGTGKEFPPDFLSLCRQIHAYIFK